MKAIFITVRTDSTRLPKKALIEINGKTTIEYVIEKAKQNGYPAILCTTELENDDILCDLAIANGILFHRGSVEDKLERWRGAAELYDVDFFVTFDGDDLLCDPELAELAFEQYEKNGADFIEGLNVPCGAFTYGIKVDALNKVCEIKGTSDTEMMMTYFLDTGLFNTESLMNVPKELQRPEIRLTLDYEDDLKFFKTIFDNLTSPTLREVVEFLDRNPEVMDINRHCHSMYLANQKVKTKLVLNESK
jgi:spore coat polysaccharide biosynthesis protein SpsF